MKQSVRLDFSSFEKAIFQLENSLEYYDSDLVQKDPQLMLHMRAAAIQAFEYTYELAWKMLKRYLEMTEPNPAEIDQMSFPDLIRLGCERGLLLSDVSVWKIYRKERGTTSHTYNLKKALEVFAKLPAFTQEAKFLLDNLQKRSLSH